MRCKENNNKHREGRTTKRRSETIVEDLWRLYVCTIFKQGMTLGGLTRTRSSTAHHLGFNCMFFANVLREKNTFAMQSMLNTIDIITIVIFTIFVFKTFPTEIENMSTRLAKPNLAIPPTSPVVCAIECIRRFPDLCDGWYKAEDIVTILIRMAALTDAKLTPGILNREINNDAAIMLIVEANKNEIGIYTRSVRKRYGKDHSYF